MKTVVLGIGLLISGIIGFAGIIIAVVSKGTLNGDWISAIIYDGLIIPFLIFTILAVLGLITAFVGAFSKSKDED